MTAERKPGEWVTGDAEDFLNDEGRPMERKTEQTNSITVHLPWQRTYGAWCCQFHDPERYCVTTGNTHDRTADREWKVGDDAVLRNFTPPLVARLTQKSDSPGIWHADAGFGTPVIIVHESNLERVPDDELSPAPSETPSPEHTRWYCKACGTRTCRVSETPSPEVGMRFTEVRYGLKSVDRLCVDCGDRFYLFADAMLFSSRPVNWPNEIGWRCSTCTTLATVAAAKEQSK